MEGPTAGGGLGLRGEAMKLIHLAEGARVMRVFAVRVTVVAVAAVLLVVILRDAGVSSAGALAKAIPGNTTIQSFSRAKKLAHEVFAGHEQTLYCGCTYHGNQVDLESCAYTPRKTRARAERLEWEHVVPAHAFGQSFLEWREGHPACVDRKGNPFKGRNCARKVAMAFRFMDADLYNLQPESAEVNLLRSNYSMAMIPGEDRTFGRCDLEIAGRKIEPRPDIRGDVARTYLYMHAAYPGRGIISRQNQQLFEAWDTEDPVDEWERERARRIERLQGNRNPF
jgi:deoxyribonuclease-1